jgi:hypothetical protein
MICAKDAGSQAERHAQALHGSAQHRLQRLDSLRFGQKRQVEREDCVVAHDVFGRSKQPFCTRDEVFDPIGEVVGTALPRMAEKRRAGVNRSIVIRQPMVTRAQAEERFVGEPAAWKRDCFIAAWD